MAKWCKDNVATFVTVMSNCRTFGVFGDLYSKRAEWREFIDSLSVRACSCGCEQFLYFTENEYEALFLVPDSAARPPPQPVDNSQLALRFIMGAV
jgi:hypothetical protein